jgi:Flp pilus assembly protein TadG
MMTALLFVPMALMAGGAIDLVEQERLRVALQNSLDRGVLAAASLGQTQDPTPLVKSFLIDAPQEIEVVVTEEKKTNFRKISATASFRFNTVFMRLANINSLPVSANATAQESRQNIELSLVLDISGSMLDNGGMAQLRPAAKNFLATVLRDDSKDFTTVNFIPFAGGVNIGDKVFDYLGGASYKRRHTKSSCFELMSGDFAAGTPPWPSRDQYPHFTYYNYNVTGKQPWWCPTASASVAYLSNDLRDLQARVDALLPFDGTGTAYGMKWAELLLNPSMKPTIKAIADKGLANAISPSFSNRPAAFNDASTLKFIVLMTDGQIGFQPRPKDITTNEVTNKNISSDARTLYDQTTASGFYDKVCAYAKAQGVSVFTIAFKVNVDVAKNIAKCATDASYAYKVDGLDMAQAFQSIATTLQKIRITQ